MPGAIIYRGPSQLPTAPNTSPAPIVVIAVWSTPTRANRKTGNMVQTYILRADMSPLDANKTGQDVSICGNCRHRGTPTADPRKKQAERRTCYVVLGQGPTIVYKTFLRGGYPDYSGDPAMIRALGLGAMVRIGTYGDGAAAPSHVWDNLLSGAVGHTAYTHNGGDPSKYMISADSLYEAQAAWQSKYRTFRVVRDTSEIVAKQEIECPSARGVQCIDCGLCAGSTKQAKSIAIVVHGSGAVHF
jgi:hypothetical protein